MEISHQYDDILNLPHHVSETHARMSMSDRAAQFSPFAALTGYSDSIAETARLTDTKRDLTEEQKQIISSQLLALQKIQKTAPEITVVFFLPDLRKDGGSYETLTDAVKKVDEYEGILHMRSGTVIPFDDILSIE